MRARVGMEIRHAQDGKALALAAQIVLVGTQEELSRKEVMPGILGNHLQGHTVLWIGSGGGIQHVDITPLQVCCQVLAHYLKIFRRHGMVYISPPDLRGGFLVRYDKFIFGRTPGMYACRRGESPVSSQLTLITR